MNFPQRIYLGLEEQKWPASLPKDLPVSAVDIETAGDYAGSCHVLEMGKHFEDYARYDWEGPSFKAVAGFPTSPTIRQLDMKARSAGVTGNIGETVTGIVAVQILQCDAQDIAHLVVQSKQKTPDFLVRYSAGFRTLLEKLVPSLAGRHTPNWWPLESKIRSSGLGTNAVKEGLWQLGGLWYRMTGSAPDDVGYGIVVCVGLEPRQVRIYVFLPETAAKQKSLVTHLKTFSEYSDFVESDMDKFANHLLKYA